jgi:signal transduction histidine kinase
MDVARAEFDVGEEIRSAVAMLRGRARTAGVALGVNLSPGLPQALGDALRLKQIVINLVGNAIKFSKPGGEVIVSARAAPGNGMLEIEVADNGIGIAPEDMPLAMAPFGQVDSTLSRRYEGTGLGLPLSKKFAELMGGELKIASQPGVGTKVTVNLPVAQMARVKVPA